MTREFSFKELQDIAKKLYFLLRSSGTDQFLSMPIKIEFKFIRKYNAYSTYKHLVQNTILSTAEYEETKNEFYFILYGIHVVFSWETE